MVKDKDFKGTELDAEFELERKKNMKINRLHLGKGIKSMRKMKGLTLDALSIDSGIDTAYISRLENGQCSPSFRTINNITAALGVTIKEFYDTLDLHLK